MRETALFGSMSMRSLPLAATLMLAACTGPRPVAVEPLPARPLETQPAGADLPSVRSDLIATARERYGSAAVDRALGASTHLIVKRFAGMVPPPPPGAAADWRPPTPSAMLIRDSDGWLAATPDGWRPASAEAAAEVERLLADARLWNEAAYTPACPDFGSSNVLLKIPRRAETVRTALCSSAAADLVQAALGA